ETRSHLSRERDPSYPPHELLANHAAGRVFAATFSSPWIDLAAHLPFRNAGVAVASLSGATADGRTRSRVSSTARRRDALERETPDGRNADDVLWCEAGCVCPGPLGCSRPIQIAVVR